MQLDTAIAEVQQIVGWRSDKVAEITRALAYAQEEREKPGMTLPWFLRKTGSVVTVAGTQTYTLPSDYIQDTEEVDGNLFYFTGTADKSRTVFLRKLSYEVAQQKYFGSWPGGDPSDQSQTVAPGIPTDYVLGSTLLHLYPTPDKVYNLVWKYWAKDATQASGQENSWLKNAPWVLIGDAAKKIGADLGNALAVATATEILSRAEGNLFRAIIHRQEAGRRRSLGSKL